MFSFFSKNLSANEKLAYDFSFNKIDGGIIELSNYKNKTLVIVNVASRCGFTKQYEGLQKIWSLYKDRGLVVIGIPSDNFNQEPGTNKEIKNFCETAFGINFPITEKIHKEIISIPLRPSLRLNEIDYISEKIRNFK